MLLKAGAAIILVSLALAAGAMAVFGFPGGGSEDEILPAEPQAAVEETVEEKKKEEFDPGEKLEIDDEPREEPKPEEPARAPRPEPRLEPPPAPPPIPDWPEPTGEEVAAANAPRYYGPATGADMTLTIEVLGLYDVPVVSSPSYEVLDRGLMHEPETSLPWDGGAQRNVFLAGHYLGWPGTASHLVFYNLDKLRRGDEVVLRDSGGRVYRYRVSEAFGATPEDSWVMGQVRNRDMLTLQTCIPPTFEERLVVRADRA
jgi:sortase A